MPGKEKYKQEYFTRFNRWRIIEHQANAIAFVVLVITGLSQKFHDSSVAEWVIMNIGGIDKARLIHRYTGLVLLVLTLQHIIIASFGVIFRRWAPTMVINRKDFTDVIDNLKYYFGMTEWPARCDRFDYKQKFEYWGVVIGGVLMVLTGLILWFPTLVFRWMPFLPGQIIPAAKATHTNEAMLAFLVIVIWHIYNSVFSPEVFPLDTSIFTGRISRERMIHEHPVEYERITGVALEKRHPAADDEAGADSKDVV
ncbi:MAG: cytochrome b/b6 domain-containing protein [Nitrospiraceae bacterium]|nr:cytochrome b/b6 domain-containing protein [Nitrospiraceae bacterium]